MGAFLRVAERACVVVALFVLAVAIAVAALLTPQFTRAMAFRLDVAASSGLSAERAAQTAESVRRFVTDAQAAPLPESVGSREGFDAAAASHLRDVRDVILALRTAAILTVLVLAVWFAVSVRLRRWEVIAPALTWGGIACIAFPALLAAAGLLSFDALFTAFHGVFFEDGTWTFPFDSLLIQLFPETFWAAAGVSLGLLVAAEGGALVLLGSMARRHSRAAGNASTDERVAGA